MSLPPMRVLYAQHPDIAKRWAKKYPNPNDLPDHVQHYLKKRVAQKAKAAGRDQEKAGQ